MKSRVNYRQVVAGFLFDQLGDVLGRFDDRSGIQVDAEYINRFIEIISDCEYAQYSPSSSGQMTEIYNGAVKMLSKFESLIKK